MRKIENTVTKQEYDRMTKLASPPSPTAKNCLCAFLTGGLICTMGQILTEMYVKFGLELQDARTAVSVSLIVLAAFLTACGVYDDIARFAGAGTLVPITGFANSMVSPAMEFKSEGFILGVGAKLFTISGPVIVYGVSASVVYGLIYWITTLF